MALHLKIVKKYIPQIEQSWPFLSLNPGTNWGSVKTIDWNDDYRNEISFRESVVFVLPALFLWLNVLSVISLV